MDMTRSRWTLWSSALALTLAACPAAFAQDADESALDELDKTAPPPPVKIEPAGAVELRDAVRRIAQRPTDSYALTDAGYASLKLGDADAAFNFFTRAGSLQPSDARIKAGLAAAMVRRENPFEALRMFDEAIKFGASERSIALDRAIAFDLLGNFERAQTDYQNARSYAISDELVRRQAMSLSMMGRSSDADVMLNPLLQKNDGEAWRARAFMLAARGDAKEAERIALGFLPENEVRRLDYYFRQMARLTPAQQAAALHFGHFPTGSNIGQDSEQMRTIAASTGVKPRPAGGDGRLIPTGEPLGVKTAKAKTEKKPRNAGRTAAVEAKRGGAVPPVATASAQAAIDRAAAAKPRTITAAALPAPEIARPVVRIVLPPAKVMPLPPVATLPLPPVKAPVQTVATAVLVETKPVTVADVKPVSAPVPVQTTPVPTPPIELPVSVATAPMPTPVPVATRSEELPPIKIASAAPAPSTPDVATAPTEVIAPPLAEKPPTVATAAPSGPGFAALDPVVPGVEKLAETPPPPSASAPVENIAIQGPPSPAPTPQIAAVDAVTVVPQTTVTEPISAPAFDLGNVVELIAIPESEQIRKVAPVDLKAIKPVAVKADTAKADLAEKAGKAAKPAVQPARIWVQIATGSDMNGLAFDYRRLAKKTPALFANVAGHTAAWGKSRRLLAGPFADIKAAKKWEADFRKNGGNGFVWQSEAGLAVDPLKGK